MSSSNRRERDLARAKRERQAARASQHQTKNRYTFVISVATVFVLLVGYAIFKDSLFGPHDDPTQTHSATFAPTNLLGACDTPPALQKNPRTWSKTPFVVKKDAFKAENPVWTLHTNCGDIDIEMYGTKAPETVRSMQFLTDNSYFDSSPCHRLTTAGLYVLQCGDPTGLGTGGPGYTIADENLPKAGANNYPAGTVAMANSGAPHSGGSQFFLVYKDTQLDPNYTIFGKITKGLDILTQIAGKGGAGGAADGAPAQPVSIISAEFLTHPGVKSASPTPTATKTKVKGSSTPTPSTTK